MESSSLLDQNQLARRWKNMSPRTLERWRWLGIGPAYLKIGGRVLYRIEDIEAFEAAQHRMPTGRRRRAAAPRAEPREA